MNDYEMSSPGVNFTNINCIINFFLDESLKQFVFVFLREFAFACKMLEN